jgi:hypothetical protein
LSAYYVLGYYTSNAKFDGKYRKLEVRVKQSGVKVTARRGYVSPTAAEVAARDAPPAPQPTAAETAVPDALAALARLRPSAEVYGYGITTGSAPEELAIVAEISSDLVEAGKWANGADVQFVVTTPSGESVGTASAHIDAGARGAVVRMPAGSSSGPWRVGVKLRGASTEGIDDAFAVAKTANTVLAEPLVSRGGPGTRSRLQPVADFAFRRTERVHVEWRELKALDARQARFLDRTGKVLPIDVTLTDRVEAGGTTLAADVSLAPLGPGDYLIELTATSGAESIRKLLAIRVRP